LKREALTEKGLQGGKKKKGGVCRDDLLTEDPKSGKKNTETVFLRGERKGVHSWGKQLRRQTTFEGTKGHNQQSSRGNLDSLKATVSWKEGDVLTAREIEKRETIATKVRNFIAESGVLKRQRKGICKGGELSQKHWSRKGTSPHHKGTNIRDIS